jgi:hypothetical protein
MAETVYLETSIFSFYYERRLDPAAVAMREWTRTWWDAYRHRYSVATSSAVLAELDAGSLPHREDALSMAMTLPAVTTDRKVARIVDAYIEHHVMPRNPLGDALHLALASCHKFDYLLTWNCEHLANANKAGHIRWINTVLGLYVPMLITPLQLMGE